MLVWQPVLNDKEKGSVSFPVGGEYTNCIFFIHNLLSYIARQLVLFSSSSDRLPYVGRT